MVKEGFDADAADRYLALFLRDRTGSVADFCAFLTESGLEKAIPENLDTVLACVKAGAPEKASFVFDPTLVRGMGYYTGTIFEIRAESFKGISIAGGGRYDRMIGKYTGNDVCACGFSIGFERMIGALIEGGFKIPGLGRKVAVLYRRSFTVADVAALQKACAKYRAEGRNILIQQMNKNLGFQKKQLADQGWEVAEAGSAEDIPGILG